MMDEHLMDEQQLFDALAEAELRYAKATARLHIAEARALVSVTYDTEEFDRVVMRYREAKRACEAMHDVWRQWLERRLAGQRTADAAAVTAETSRLPTPRLRFARWLYEHGHIAG